MVVKIRNKVLKNNSVINDLFVEFVIDRNDRKNKSKKEKRRLLHL